MLKMFLTFPHRDTAVVLPRSSWDPTNPNPHSAFSRMCENDGLLKDLEQENDKLQEIEVNVLIR